MTLLAIAPGAEPTMTKPSAISGANPLTDATVKPRSGITVNCVSPGIVATREILARFERRAERQGLSTDRASVDALILREFMPNPSGLVGTPEDVGNLVAFLASDRARYVNAANLRIDGGAADCVQ